MTHEIKLTLDRNLSQEEIDNLAIFIKSEDSRVSNVEITPIVSIGMTGAEILISIIISFTTSLAASATYDYGKKIITHLNSKGITSEQEDQEE